MDGSQEDAQQVTRLESSRRCLSESCREDRPKDGEGGRGVPAVPSVCEDWDPCITNGRPRASATPGATGRRGEAGEQCVPAWHQHTGRYSLPAKAPDACAPLGEGESCVPQDTQPATWTPATSSKAPPMVLMDGRVADAHP
eukprot:1850172-Pyramimonas_sp.AAC.1